MPRIPRFKKGSQEAKDYMSSIRLKKGDPRIKNIGKTPKPKSKIKQEKEYDMELPVFGDPVLAVPEFMGVRGEKGKVSIVNPLTNARNLASRESMPSVKLVRKPIKTTHLEKSGSMFRTSLASIKKRQRGKAQTYYAAVLANADLPVNEIQPIGKFRNAERGRPEVLPKNIRVNKSRANIAKKAGVEPKHHSTLRKRKKKMGIEEDEEMDEEMGEEADDMDEEEPEEEKKPRKKREPKYKTDEEKLEAERAKKRKWAEKNRREKGVKPRKKKGEEEPEMEGGKISAKDLKALHQSSYKKDKDKAVGDWELDESISKPTASVYVNKKTKQPIVVHRGTEGTLSDWANNLAYVAGVSKKTKRYKDSEAVQKDAEAKYGDTLTTGHSQGSVYSKLAKNKKGIIDVNPASMGEVAEEGTTIRSKSDPVSLLAGVRNMFSKNKKNITTSAKANPLEAHSLDILDEVGDVELGNGLKGRGKKFSHKQLTDIILHKNKVIEDLEKNAYDKISGKGIMNMMGCGGVHHHYHMLPDGGMTGPEVMSGKGFESMLRDVGKYVQPLADAGMDRAIKEIKGSGFKKGSPEAKAHMAKIRGMKKGMKKEESESDSESEEEMPKMKSKRKGRMVKGSPEAMAWAEKMRASRKK